MNVALILGDCLTEMAKLHENWVDAVVCDPPYGLSFMGKDWDHGCPGVHFWQEAVRVAKPGAHLLAFGGTRTFHRLACAIEDAGWEIRDTVMWVYGSGFPKSHDVSKAIDKMKGAKREVMGKYLAPDGKGRWGGNTFSIAQPPDGRGETAITAPATPEAAKWQGWGTALKPAWEPIIVARKPLEGTVAENVTRYGTGAINVDGCRGAITDKPSQMGKLLHTTRLAKSTVTLPATTMPFYNDKGRWPANLIHDGSDEVLAGFPNGSSRFFYVPKASKKDRDEGCDGLEDKITQGMRSNAGPALVGDDRIRTISRNNHPTVKPTALMRYLCRLVTPPGGIVLDPFMGSGSTGKAAVLEGFSFIGIEKEAEYIEIAKARIAAARKQETLAI